MNFNSVISSILKCFNYEFKILSNFFRIVPIVFCLSLVLFVSNVNSQCLKSSTFENHNSVISPNNAGGLPNATVAVLDADADYLTLDLGVTLNPGDVYKIFWRRNLASGAGTSTIEVLESINPTSGFVSNTNISNSKNVEFTATGITASVATRYVRLSPTAAGEDSDIDALFFVLPGTTVTLTGASTSTCDDEADLSFTGSPAGGTFTTNIPAGFSSAGSTANVDVSLAGPGDFYINYEYTDANGCTATAAKTINICDSAKNNALINSCSGDPTEITGAAWIDDNYDGEIHEFDAKSLSGVVVELFDCDGNLVSTTTTADDGSYSFTGLTTGEEHRVEFSFPDSLSYLSSTKNGVNGMTNTQFVMPGDCAYFGANDASGYCEDNPEIFITCFVDGDAQSHGDGFNDAVLSVEYGAGTMTPNHATVAGIDEVGSVLGLAYQPYKKDIFVAAFVKRHVGLGPDGTGAIYKIDDAGNVGVFADLNVLVGPDAAGADPRGPGFDDYFHDSLAFYSIGRSGLGDIETNPEETELYVVNMEDGKLYTISTDGATEGQLIGSGITIPNTCMNSIDARPMALKFHKGKLYVGNTCSAESTVMAGGVGDDTQLKAEVFEFDPITMTFNTTPVLSDTLNYDRGCIFTSFVNADSTTCGAFPGNGSNFRPWQPNWKVIYNDTFPFNVNNQQVTLEYPQPLLSDIEFVDGNMVLGIRDINGDMTGYENGSPDTNESDTHRGNGMGDMLKACGSQAGGWTLESNGSCGGETGMANNLQGPGGGEYYWDDGGPGGALSAYQGGHPQANMGSMAVNPVTGAVLTTKLNTHTFYSSGISYYQGSEHYLESEVVPTVAALLGKSNGLGDMELLCGPAPLEIGNYIWLDTDKDGIQDPCEMALSGVEVFLYDENGVLIKMTTTDASGAYYFNDTLEINKEYNIVIGGGIGGQFDPATGDLSFGGNTYHITDANTGEGSNPDFNDSNGTIASGVATNVNGFPYTSITTKGPGFVDHTLDFGFVICEVVITGLGDEVCVGEIAQLMSTPSSGIAPYTYSWSGPGSLDDASVQNPTITNTQLSDSGIYEVIVVDNVGCIDSVEVKLIVNPLPTITAGSDGPKCVGETLNLTSAGTATSWSWSGPNSFTSTDEDPVIMNVSASAGGTYKVIGTNGNGCVDSSEVTVVINALPTITAGSDEPKCVGETLNLTSSGTSTMWLWSGPNSFTSTSEDPVIMIVSAAAAGTYKVVGTNGNGCVDSSEVTVVINALPTITAGSDEPKCVGETLNLTSSGTSTSWIWSGPNSFTSTAEDPVIMNVSAAAGGVYKVIGTNGNGCVDSSEVTVVINALPTITAGSDEPKCVGETLNLTSSGTSTSWIWSGPNSFTSTAEDPVIMIVSAAAAGTYKVVGTNGNGCVDSSEVTVVINALPTITAGSDEPKCVGETLNLTSSGTSTSWIWSGPNSFTSTAEDPVIMNVSAAAAGTYKVVGTNGNGCVDSSEVTVVINALPTITAGSDEPKCVGETLNLTSSGTSTSVDCGVARIVLQVRQKIP